MGQALLHFKTHVESPRIEKDNILSLTCIYCYEEILFEIPKYRLKLGLFPIQLVSRHGDPVHDFSIEVLENHEVKIVKQEDDRANSKPQPVKHEEIPLLPEEDSEEQISTDYKVPEKLLSMDTPLPNVHSFPHLPPHITETFPTISPSKQVESKPSLKLLETVQEIPEPPVFEEKEDDNPINHIKALIHKLPSLTREEIAEEMSRIAPYFAQNPSFYKVASEIRNWVKDIHRMEWNDTQVRALTHQLTFWSEKLSQLA